MSIMKIKDLTEQIRGVSYKPSDVVTSDVGLPILRANNIKGNSLSFDDLVFVKPERVSKKQILQNGDIVICASSGSKELVGKSGVFSNNDMYSFGAFCKAVRVKRIDGINSNYVRLYFGSKYYRECIAMSSKGSNINNIKTENIEELSINIPSAEEQNIAVSLLNALISAIKHKKQELSSLDELVKSRFIEMFGDCKKITLQKFCKFQQGTQVPIELQSEQQKDGYLRFLRIIDYTQAPQIPRYVNVKGKIVDEQSVVVVRYGASAGFVGKGYSGILANNLFEIIPDESIMSKYFLYCALKYGNFESEISKKCAGVAMPALSFGIMKDMEIYNPLIELQNEFAEFVKLIDKSKFIVQQQIKDLQELLDSKMDEYFR